MPEQTWACEDELTSMSRQQKQNASRSITNLNAVLHARTEDSPSVSKFWLLTIFPNVASQHYQFLTQFSKGYKGLQSVTNNGVLLQRCSMQKEEMDTYSKSVWL